MVVCSCKAVSCHRIREAVAKGARTVGQVRRACGAAACCGGCRPLVVEIMSEELVHQESKVVSIGRATSSPVHVARVAQQG